MSCYVMHGTLGLTGVKPGCGLEQCVSCAVLIDGVSTLCCNRPVAGLPGKENITVAEVKLLAVSSNDLMLASCQKLAYSR